jgi:glyoxylate/hydroxypyruvate reductase A
MAIVLCAPDRDLQPLALAIQARDPDLDVRIWPDHGPPAEIEFAVLWKHPAGLLKQLPNLRAVCSLGAGVDHLRNDPDLPKTLPVCRLAGPRLAQDMAAWVVAQVLWHWRRLDQFAHQQAQARWQPWAPARQPHVGLLGFGVMGQACGRALQGLGIEVSAWVQRPRVDDTPVKLYTGPDGLLSMAASVDVLVCLLPLSAETDQLINAQLLAQLPPGALLINAGRGEHVVDEDLLQALDQGQLSGAVLDSFRIEPLPSDHPFWHHPKVRVSPHCAAITQVDEAAQGIISQYQQLRQGNINALRETPVT